VAVGLADEGNAYPFAGYKEILGQIYAQIISKEPFKVLDIGIGTATLAARLHKAGHSMLVLTFPRKC